MRCAEPHVPVRRGQKFLSSNTQDFIEVRPRREASGRWPPPFLSSNTQDFIEVANRLYYAAISKQFLSSNTQDFIEVRTVLRRSRAPGQQIPEL